MSPASFRLRAATMFALAMGLTTFAARPAVADVESVAIDFVNTTENGSIDVEVGFTWKHKPSEVGVTTYRADIYLEQLDPVNPQATFTLDAASSPESVVAEFVLDSDTPAGCYHLTVDVVELIGGSVILTSEDDTAFDAVCIGGATPEDPVGVAIDIKPGSCPNPIQTGKRGVIPVAIVGTADLPVSEINPDSVTLMGVEPLRFSYEDVATPYFPVIDGEEVDCLDCTTARGDGFVDLTLKFDAQEVVAAIETFYGGSADRDCLVLFLEGERTGGTPILGADIVRIQKSGKKGGPATTKSNKKKSKKKK